MLHYVFKAEFVTLVRLKVPSGFCRIQLYTPHLVLYEEGERHEEDDDPVQDVGVRVPDHRVHAQQEQDGGRGAERAQGVAVGQRLLGRGEGPSKRRGRREEARRRGRREEREREPDGTFKLARA